MNSASCVSEFAGWVAGQLIFTGLLTHPINKNDISRINDNPNALQCKFFIYLNLSVSYGPSQLIPV
jgi:hypothetical protein